MRKQGYNVRLERFTRRA